MFPAKNLLALLIVALASTTLVSAESHDASRRNHVQLNRMVRKRATDLGVVGVGQLPPNSDTKTSTPVANAGANPTDLKTAEDGKTTSSAAVDTTSGSTTAASSAGTTSSGSTTASSVAASSSATSSSIVSSSASSASASSLASSSVPLSSSTVVSSSTVASISTTTTSSSVSVAATSPPPKDTPATTPPSKSTLNKTVVVVDATSVVGGTAASSVPSSAPTGAVSTTTKVSLAVIGAIAGSIGGVALIWTIIRKWKFRPSAEFEDRMQPINWQPTDANDDGLSSHRRSVASSFHSAGHEENFAGRGGGGGGYGATSNSGHGVSEHDFTAGTQGLAPVGGYADLARGPSPQPYDTSRGPSPPMAQVSQYDRSMPLHYQNGAYGDEYNLGNGTTGPRY